MIEVTGIGIHSSLGLNLKSAKRPIGPRFSFPFPWVNLLLKEPLYYLSYCQSFIGYPVENRHCSNLNLLIEKLLIFKSANIFLLTEEALWFLHQNCHNTGL